MRFANRKIVGNKHHIHFGLLGDQSNLFIVFEVNACICLSFGVSPRCNMMAGWIKKRPKPHFFTWATHDDPPVLFSLR
jgi:hypothetical protein